MAKNERDIPPFHDVEDKEPRAVISIPNRGQFRVRANQLAEFRKLYEEAKTDEDLDRVAEQALISELGVTRARVRETFPDGLPNRTDLTPDEGQELVAFQEKQDRAEAHAKLRAAQDTAAAPQEATTVDYTVNSPLTMIGTDRNNRRFLYDTPAGPKSALANVLDEDGDPLEDPRYEHLMQFAASMLAQGARLDTPGGYQATPQPTRLGELLQNAKEIFDENYEDPNPLERTLGHGMSMGLKGLVGFASVLRSTFETLGFDFPEDRVEEMAGPGGLPPIETAEVAEATGSPAFRDVSEPHVALTAEEFEKLEESDPSAIQLRLTKMLLDSTFRGSVIGPAISAKLRGEDIGDQTFTNIGAIQSGELAPPANEKETLVQLIGHDVLGPMIPSLAVWPAFTAAGTAFGGTRVGQAAAGAIGTPARLTALSTLGGAGAGGAGGAMLNQMGLVGEEGEMWETAAKGASLGGGLVGGRVAFATRLGRSGQTVSAFTKAFQARAPQFFGTVGAEAALSSTFGAAYGGRAAFESGHTDDIAKQAMYGALAGGIFGFGFALPFRVRGMSQAGRAGRIAQHMADEGVLNLRKGEIFNSETGLMFGGRRKNGSVFWQVKDPETGKVRFAKKSEIPDELAVHDWLVEKWVNPKRQAEVDELSSLIDRIPQVEWLKARQHLQDGQRPLDTPIELRKAEEFGHLVTMREINYRSSAFQQLKRAADEGNLPIIQKKIDTFKMAAASMDPDTQLHMKAELLGRARALERIRAEGIRGRAAPQGEPPAAFEGIQAYKFENRAAEILADSPPDIQHKFLILQELKANFGKGQDKLNAQQLFNAAKRQLGVEKVDPEILSAASTASSEAVDNINFKSTRGLRAGSKVMHEGQPAIVEKVSEHTWGMAQIRKGSADPEWVNLSDVQVIPKVNRTALMSDGTPVKVLRTASDELSVLIQRPDGAKNWVDLEFIEAAGDGYKFNQKNAKAFKQAEAAIRDGQRAPKETVVNVERKTVVDKETGEKLTVEQANNEEYVARTASGKAKVIDKELTKDVPTPDSPVDDIYTFAAGTKPTEGRNIVFVRGQKPEASIFAEIMRSHGDRTALVDVVGGEAHIFPVPPKEGEVLFAVEFEAKGKPNASGRKALGVLNDNVEIDNMTRRQWENLLTKPGRILTPEELVDAKIYEVPRALQNHVLRPNETFELPVAAKKTYLSKLTDMSFEVNKEAARAKARGDRAAELIDSAKKRNRGDDVTQATREIEQARADIVKAHIRQNEEILEAASQVQAERIQASASIPDAQESLRLLQGEPGSVRRLIGDYPTAGDSFNYQPLVFDHPEIPGARLVLHKVGMEDLSMTSRRLIDPKDNTPGVKYLLEEFSESGQLVNNKVISTTSERTSIAVPARSTADLPLVPEGSGQPGIAKGDLLLAVSDEGVSTVMVADVKMRKRGGTAEIQGRVTPQAWQTLKQAQAARKEVGEDRFIYEGFRKPTRSDPRTHLTEAEMIQKMQQSGFARFSTSDIRNFLRGKNLEGTPQSIRQSISPEGKEVFDDLQTKIKALRELDVEDAKVKQAVALLQEQIQALPQDYPIGSNRVQLIDTATGEGFGNSAKSAVETPTPYMDLRSGDKFPDKVFDSNGKTVRLYRSVDPADQIERINIPRTQDELDDLTLRAAQAEQVDGLTAVKDIPYRTILSEAQVLDRVMERVSTFDTRASAFMNGSEWRSAIPGLYATLYKGRGDRWIVNFWNTARNRKDPQALPSAEALGGPDVTLKGKTAAKFKAAVSLDERTGQIIQKRTFPTKKAAEDFLKSEEFHLPENFETAPRTNPAVARLIDDIYDRMNSLADEIPDNLSVDEFLGTYSMKQRTHVDGMSSNDVGVDNPKTLAAYKRELTRRKNALVDQLRERGFRDDAIETALISSRNSAKDILVEPAPAGGVSQILDDLPHPEAITKGQLKRIEADLTKAWMHYYNRNNGYIPPELRNYMFNYATKRYQIFGGDSSNPPFNAEIRRSVGYWADADIATHGKYAKGVDNTGIFDPEATPTRVSRDPGGTVLTGDEPTVDPFTIMPGRRVDRRVLSDDQLGVTSDAIETWQAAKKFHDDIMDKGPLFKRLDDIDDPTDTMRPIEDISVARVRLDTGRELVQITGYDFDNATAQIMTTQGTFHEVPLSDLSLIRSAKAKFDFVTHSKIAADEPMLIPEGRDIGYHDVDKGLGIRPGAEPIELGRAIAGRLRRLLGEDDPIIRQKFPDIPETSKAPIRFTKKGTLYKLTSPEQMNELMELHIRSVEIDRPGEVINRLPEKYRTPFKRSVYDFVVEQRGDAPLTYIEALVKSGLATSKQLTRLAEHAKANGIESTNSMIQFRELAKLNKLDPALGKLMLAMNKEAGYARIMDKISSQTVDISRVVRPNDIHIWDRWLSSPQYVAERSPSAEMFTSLIWDSQIRENQFFENMVVKPNAEIMAHYKLGGMTEIKNKLVKVMRGSKAKELEGVRQIKEARELLSKHRTWDDVLDANPDIDPGVKFAFEKLREMTDTLKPYVIQSAVRQGRTWVRFGDLDDGAQARVAQSFGQKIKDMDPDARVVDQFKHKDARRNKAEAHQFTELLNQFNSAKDIPKKVRATLPEWMVQEFDLWKNFGIENYWPRIHRGKIRIQKINDDGTFTTIAWARDGREVNASIQNALDEGRIQPNDIIEADPVGYTLDDVMTNVLDSNDFDRLIQGMMKAAKIEPARASEILAGANIKTASSRTTLQNLQLRQMDLQSLIPNPLEEMQIYGARVARNQYLLDVDEAFTWVKRNDEHLAAAFGQESMNSGKMTNLSNWFNDMWSTAKGERGYIETLYNDLVLGLEFLGTLPARIFEDMKADGPGVLADPKIREKWMNTKFHESPYRAKEFSNGLASTHGLLKLGFTPSSAAVNLSQLAINTYPVLGEKFFISGVNNYANIRLGRNMDAALRADLVDVLEQAGVKWQRSIATQGAGLQQPGQLPPGIMKQTTQVIKDMHHPRTPQEGSMGNISQMVNQVGMTFFEGAEQVNRSITAIGAYQRGIASKADGGLGLSREAAIEFAKKTVGETQFLYFDQALPRILRGPAAKVMMQFKPYLYNQIRFEKNLIKSAMRRDPEAIKAIARHYGAIMMLGGLRGVAKHPVTGPLVALWALSQGKGANLYGDPYTMAEDHWDAQNAPMGTKPDHWVARDVLNHGLPGLLGISVANRVGIAGTDLNFWGDFYSFAGGPQGSLVAQLALHQNMVRQQEGGATQVNINAGGALLAKTMAELAGKKLPPLGLITAALLTNELQSALGDTPGRGVFTEDDVTQTAPSTEAERLIRNLYPKILIDFERAGLIMGDHLYYDTSGKPVPVPLTGLDHISAAAGVFAGFQPTFDANRLAAEQTMRSRDQAAQATRRAYLSSMARAALNDDWEELMKLKAAAIEKEIYITEEQIMAKKRQLQEHITSQRMRALMLEGLVEFDREIEGE